MLKKSISAKLGMFRFVPRSLGFKQPSLNVMLLLAAWLVASPFGQAHAATFFWDANGATAGTGGTGNWETTTSLWRAGSDTGTLGIWSNIGGDNDALLGGTAGTVTLTTGISVNDITVDPTSGTAYIIGGATQTLTLVGIAKSVIDVASGDSLAITSGLAGTNGFTKNSAGTLILDSAAGTARLLGSITLNGGTLQAGSATNNGASQVLRSNAVNLASGTSLTTVGTNIDLRVGSLSGSGSVTPATGGAINILALADSTFSGAITTTGGLTLRGANGTTQTFNGNLTALTGTIGINSGATLRLSGTGNSTSGVLGSLALAPRGGTIVLDNTAGNTSAGTGRIVDTATVTFLGGTLSLLGNSAGTTENVGNITLNSGAATVSVTHNGGAGGTALNFANSGTFSLRGSTSATVNFVGNGGTLGSTGANPRITFTGTPFTGTAGLFSNTAGGGTIGFATVNTTSWAGLSGNSVVALSPTVTSGTNSGIQVSTSSDIVVFNPSSSQTASAAVSTAVMTITPGTSGLSLGMGPNNLSAAAIMLTGANAFSITGSGAVFGTASGTKYAYVTDSAGVLSTTGNMLASSGNGSPVNKSGLGTLSLEGTSNQFSNSGSAVSINVLQGILRTTSTAIGGFASTNGAFTTINLYGGTLELSGGGSFSRALGAAGTASGGGLFINNSGTARGDGGFSAIGANASVNLVTAVGGSTAAAPVWDTTAGFVSNGYALLFGSRNADSRIDFTNNIGLDDGTAANNYFAREIRVTDNTGSSTDIARLSGIVSGSANADLHKTGAGVLELTGANTYSGNTLISAGTLQVGSGSTTGTLGSTGAIQNNGILSVNRSDALSITAPISGTGSLTKLAAGTLTLSGSNTYSGGTTHSAGIINISDASALGTGTFTFNGYNRLQINVADGASMTVANNFVLPSTGTGDEAELIRVGDGSPTAGTTARLTGIISGGNSGAIFSLDSDQGSNHNNTLILDNASNSFSGTLELWRGALAFTSDGALGNVNNTIRVNNAGFNGGLRFDANNITTASTRTFQLVGNEKIDTQAFTAAVNGAISGTGSLRKIGSGSLTLGGTNSYSGGTTNVAGGNLRVSGGAAIPNASAVTLDNTAGVGLELLANETVGSVSGGGATGGNINLNDKTLTLEAATATSFAGVISGTGGVLTKSGNSVFTLTGTNTYTGGTNLNAGSLNINNGSALGTGTLSVGTTATGTFLQVANTAAVTLANNIVLPSPGSAQRIDLIKNTASASTGTQINLTGDISGGSSNLTLRVTSDTSGDNTTSYRFAGNNSFSGKVELFRGAISIGSSTALGTATLQLNGNNNTTLGDLRFESSMTFANNIELVNTANPDPIHTNGNTVVLSGVISSPGTQALVKIGTGTLVLAGANTYTVGTTISGGTLQVGNGGTTGTLGSTSAVNNNAALIINRSDSITVTPVISGTGSLTQAGAGTTTVSGANTFTGPVNVTGGTLAVATVATSATAQPLGQATTPVTLSSGSRLRYTGVGASWDRGITVTTGSTGTVQNSGSGELTLTGPISKDGSTLTFSGTQPIKVSSVITGASSNSDLVIEDTTVTLSNANTYNGPTTINNGGKLAVTNTTGSATSTGNVQANSGSVILGTGFIQPASGGTVTISSGAKVSVGNASGDTTGNILTFTPASGSITTFFQSGSTLEFDLFSGAGLGDQSGNLAAADLFRTGGLFDISTAVKLKVNSAMTGFAANDRWQLLDWNTAGGTAPTGTFDTALFELPTLTGMLGWDLSQFYTAGTISVAVVPEPTRVLLLAFGLVGILTRRRR